MESEPLRTGVEVIADAARKLPHKPGVYRMIDAKGRVLYVGKAKDLPKRVSQYTQLGRLSTRILMMVQKTASMECITARSEAEALLLEANYIKQFRPPYNILLTDDKTFPFIRLDINHAFPRIHSYRGTRKDGALYFGPFASPYAVKETLTLLQKAFLLRPCKDTMFANRSRPCLQYDIKRCSAPCVGLVEQDTYAELVAQAKKFLKGDSAELQKTLSKEMEEASARMEFEKAATLRDRIKMLAAVQHLGRMTGHGMDEADVIALAREGDQACIQLFFYRQGQNLGNRPFFLRCSPDDSDARLMGQFLTQYYADQPCAESICLNLAPDEQNLIEEALSQKEGRKIRFTLPQRGDKVEAVTFATRNASEALARKLAEGATTLRYLAGVQTLCHLPRLPQRIETYDNSHLMGTNAISAMVVAGPDGFMKGAYRRFNVPLGSVMPGDDYGMMRAVMQRRFKEAEAESLPDLLLIDGGLGQLNVVRETLDAMGLTSLVAMGVAKGPDRNAGRETFYLPGHEPFDLPVNDPVLHYIQRLRDEAHRFAIGGHRARRGKAMVESTLDTIPGVGPKRKKALLHHFGSAKALRDATREDLESAPGISASTAAAIYEHFHPEE